jgi:uncharacterized protein DUF6941
MSKLRVRMLLCDAAQAVNGKLYILGAGWNVTGPDPTPSAIALQVDVPWDEANERHRLKLSLVTQDGHPVRIPTPAGEHPVEFATEFEIGRPAGHPNGSPLNAVLGVNLPPLPLPPASRFEWRCYVDNETDESWMCAFSTRPAPEKQAHQQL